MDISNSGSFTINEETGQIELISGGISGFSSGAITIQGYAMDEETIVNINNVVFQNNNKGSSSGGAAFQYVEQTRGQNQIPQNQINISNSAFYQNSAGYGTVFIDRSVGTNITNSVFESNQADHYGGALVITRSQDTVIRDTSFIDNTAGEYGGAIYIGVNTPQPIQFGGTTSVRPAIDFVTDGWDSGYEEAVNLTIEAVYKNVIFSGNQAKEGSDIYINYGAANRYWVSTGPEEDDGYWTTSAIGDWGKNSVNLNLGANSGRKVEFNGDIIGKGYESYFANETFSIHVNSSEEQTGEVVFNGVVQANVNPMMYFYRGTLSLGRGDSLSEIPVTFMDPDASILCLNLSQNKVDQYSFDEVYFDKHGTYFLNIKLDVDLSQALVDTVDWGRFNDDSKLQVNIDHWNVLSDLSAGVQETEVTVNEGGTDSQLAYGLTENGKKATGKLYIYDVTLLDDKNGTYKFTNAGFAPDQNPNNPSKPTPSDFNREVYAGAITQKITQLFQHEISHRLFDMNQPADTLITSTSGTLNGSIHGGQVSFEPEDYGDDIDVDYGVTLFSYFNSPINYGETSTQVGAYGGFVVSDAEDDVNDINSRGAFIGIATKTTLANLFADWHANVGYLTSDFGSRLGGSSDVENIWLGTGISLGYEWSLSQCGTTIIPSIDAIYTFVDGKDFETAHDVDIENGDFKGWEVSPGVRVEQQFGFDHSWKVYGEARYIWSDDNLDLKAINLTGAENEIVGDQVLPGLKYGDYTELNFGFKKDFGDWQIHAGADCRIGEIDGWGGGIAAKWQF